MAKVTDEQFIAAWRELKSPRKVAKYFNLTDRGVYRRREKIEQIYNIDLSTDVDKTITYEPKTIKRRIEQRLAETKHSVRRGIMKESGTAIVFSDAHFYPNLESTAYKALIHFIKELQPEVIVCNGDAFDGASISRHPRIGWDSKPSVMDELKAVYESLNTIAAASKFKQNLIWSLGNHDARFENFLAANAPQFEGVKGFTLKDHFPEWQPCWSYWFNDDVVVKHRWKGGRYAGSNNTTFSGCSIITGHTHQLKVEPFTDYNGTRYGVQTGMLAYPKGEQFVDYTEDSPVDWRSGFCVLTWYNHHLLMPELVQVFNEEEGLVQFRGNVIQV